MSPPCDSTWIDSTDLNNPHILSLSLSFFCLPSTKIGQETVYVTGGQAWMAFYLYNLAHF